MRQIVCRERHLEQVCCVFTLIAIACRLLRSVSQQHRVKNLAQRVNGINDFFKRLHPTELSLCMFHHVSPDEINRFSLF